MRRSATAHRENRYAHPTWRRGEHRIGELRTAAARGGALASPPHRHLFPLISPAAAEKGPTVCATGRWISEFVDFRISTNIFKYFFFQGLVKVWRTRTNVNVF